MRRITLQSPNPSPGTIRPEAFALVEYRSEDLRDPLLDDARLLHLPGHRRVLAGIGVGKQKAEAAAVSACTPLLLPLLPPPIRRGSRWPDLYRPPDPYFSAPPLLGAGET